MIVPEVNNLVNTCRQLSIKTVNDFKRSEEMLGVVKGMKKQAEAFVAPINEQLTALKKTVAQQKKNILDPLEEAEDILKTSRIGYAETNPDIIIDVREYWSAEVTDIMALAHAVIDGAVASDVLQGNAKFLNEIARVAKGKLAIPGVKAISYKGETWGGK